MIFFPGMFRTLKYDFTQKKNNFSTKNELIIKF